MDNRLTRYQRKPGRHPCFDKDACKSCGRIHIPVAPACNIQCNYCNRRYDCTNESRPGVCSRIIEPSEAVAYLSSALSKEPRITVAGIAGPGDPFAQPKHTLQTLYMVKKAFPSIILCLSSNGLAVPRYVERIVELGVTHMTITVNAIDPIIGSRVYKWIRPSELVGPLRGTEGARLLISRQLESIRLLKDKGIKVKVNSVIIPGVNHEHLIDIAKVMSSLGVDLMNCIPLIPVKGTAFQKLGPPDKGLVTRIRKACSNFLPQMTHCVRCRADAVGLLKS